MKNPLAIMAVLSLAVSFAVPTALLAAGPAEVNLRTAGNFVVLAKSGVSTTGTTLITGDVGVSPVSASHITGFGLMLPVSSPFSTSAQVVGKVYAPDYADPTSANLTTAILDMQTAYNDAVGRVNPTATELGAGNIGGLTIAPGLYKWGTSVIIPSDVTLSGGADDVWIFQVAQTLTVSSGVKINLSGGAQAKNIFWVVTGQTTVGTGAQFSGIILDQTAIVFSTGATLNGRALAQTAVTFDSNAVVSPVAVVMVPKSAVTPPVKNPLTYTLKTDKTTYTQDENINITLSALNSSSEAQTLSFTNGCQTSYTIALYDSSKNQTCTMALTSVVIAPNTTKDWIMTHRSSDYKVPVGAQNISGKVSNQGEASAMITVIASTTTVAVSTPPEKQFFLNVISPNGGEVWKIGEEKLVQVNITGAPANSYLLIVIDGPTPIDIKGQLNPSGNISFNYTLPKSGCYTDMCNDLKTGSYRLVAVLYDKAPCNMRADCIRQNLLITDRSDALFTVSTSTTSALVPVPLVATTRLPDTIVSVSQPSSNPSSCPAGKTLTCSAGMLKPDGTNTSVCACVKSVTPILSQSNLGQEVKKISKGLWSGSRGEDVAILQQFLVSQNKGPAAQALAKVGTTKHFGKLTRAALAEFQTSVGITPALGNFGSKTRAYISAQY